MVHTLLALSVVTVLSIVHVSLANEPPCVQDDLACWRDVGIRYLNEFRQQTGKPLLRAGPSLMQENAIDHARDMSETGVLFHQDPGYSSPSHLCVTLT